MSQQTQLDIDLYDVRFSGTVFAEFDAIIGSSKDVSSSDETALHEVLVALDTDAKIVVNRKYNNTYEVSLSVEGVEAFAREVAYYLEHALGCRSECGGDRAEYDSISKTVNGCKSALASANRVLESLGKPLIHSYFQ